MGRLMEFLHPGRDRGNDDGRAVAISYVVLDHKDGRLPPCSEPITGSKSA